MKAYIARVGGAAGTSGAANRAWLEYLDAGRRFPACHEPKRPSARTENRGTTPTNPRNHIETGSQNGMNVREADGSRPSADGPFAG